jgi:hypothetical protein
MPVALIGAGIAAASSVAGAVISSSGAKSAANTAAQTAANNNALQQQIYQQNTANEQPFMQRGNAAGSQINDLLGLGGNSTTPTTTGTFDPNTYLADNPDVLAGYNNLSAADRAQFPTPQAYAQYHYNTYGTQENRQGSGLTTANLTPAQSAMNAFNNFKNSDGYQFRLGEGLNAANTNYALRGSLGSGAALKALNNYAQGQASNEFGNYVGMLQNQQGVGLSAANALNGVGTNYANAVSSNNNNAAGAAITASGQSASAINGGINGLGAAVNQALGTSSSYSNGASNSFNSAFDSNFLNSVNGG